MSTTNEVYYTSDGEAIAYGPGNYARGHNIAKASLSKDGNVRVRDDVDRSDFQNARGSLYVPINPKQRIIACMDAAENMGIVRNVIDMMADFVCKGVDLAHPVPSIEKFYKQWWKKIGGQDRCERAANLLYRAGQAVFLRSYANITTEQKDQIRSGDIVDDQIETSKTARKNKFRIPWDYQLQNPASLEVIAGEIDLMIGKDKLQFGVRLDKVLLDQINEANKFQPKSKDALQIPLPRAFFNLSDENKPNIYKLDPNNTIPLYYKKDDWQLWAVPMIFPILHDLQVYEKLRLADLAALDGACNYVRIFALGDIEAKLYPAPAAFAKLSEILASNSAGGPMDIVWGPDIKIIESSTDLSKFLSIEKYIPTLLAIYSGLGIPPVLTGLPTSSGTASNSFFTLKTLIERLQYVRNVLIDFWENELLIVSKEMGFSSPAQLVFDHPTISDESTQNKLLIELLDRNIISAEAVLERADFIPLIEAARLKKENKARDKGKMPEKVSALQIPETQAEMAQTTFENQKELAKQNNKAKQAMAQTKAVKGQPGQGRELGQKDSSKRKPKVMKPRTKAVAKAMVWAKAAQKTISDIITPIYLESAGKKNLRQLTTEEFTSFEELKFNILYASSPEQEITKESVIACIYNETDTEAISARSEMLKDNQNQSTEYIRDLESAICAAKHYKKFKEV